jgi:hypothetical protein
MLTQAGAGSQAAVMFQESPQFTIQRSPSQERSRQSSGLFQHIIRIRQCGSHPDLSLQMLEYPRAGPPVLPELLPPIPWRADRFDRHPAMKTSGHSNASGSPASPHRSHSPGDLASKSPDPVRRFSGLCGRHRPRRSSGTILDRTGPIEKRYM